MKPQLSKQWNERAVLQLIEQRDCLASTKLDGIRLLAKWDEKTLEFTSRSGKGLAGLEAYRKQFEEYVRENRIRPFLLDGEVFVNPEIADFYTGAGMIRGKTPVNPDHLQYWVWQDLGVPNGEHGRYLDRHDAAERLITGEHLPCFVLAEHWIQDISEVHTLYQKARESGYEGLIIKDLSQPHVEGKVNGWYKMKPEDTVDGHVTDIKQLYSDVLKEYLPMVGTVKVSLEGGGETWVGTGWSKDQRIKFWEDPSKLIGRCVEVSFMERTPDGNLRHPAFKQFRDTEDNPGIKV